MIIYLEGPDGSGKSTLADKIVGLCKELNIECIRNAEATISTHPARPNRVTKKQLFEQLEFMANEPRLFILDRGPISDSIYRMFDNYDPVCKLEDYAKLFRKFIDSQQMLIIYTRTNNAEKAMLERGDDNPVSLKRHKELTKAYDMIMGCLNYSLNNVIWRYDYTLPCAEANTFTLVKNILNPLSQKENSDGTDKE